MLQTTAFKKQKIQPDNFEKGLEFEKYVISLFNERNFFVRKHHQSKKYDGSLPYDLIHPDLEMELVFSHRRRYKFAVECKWRKEFKNGEIAWATYEQICSYQDFKGRTNVPVFIAIGIGGEPSNPEKLYVTPLDMICMQGKVYEAELLPFTRKPTHKFFYNPSQSQLF